MVTISDQQRRWRLGHRHLLAESARTNDVEAIAGALVGLHSSDPATVFLSAMARMVTPSIEAIEDALYETRTIVRHHAMRRTIWVMPIRTARAAHAATTSKIAAAERKRTLKAIEASGEIADADRWFTDAGAEVRAAIEQAGSLSTRELGQALPHLAVPLEFGSNKNSATLNAHTKVLQGAGFDASLVRGRPAHTWTSSEYPWSVTEDWLGEPIVGLAKREAAAELVDLWLRRFGPGTEADLVWWFGDTKTLIRNALADIEATPVVLESGAPAWVAKDDDEVDEPEPWVRLLPGLDSTSMGWKERDFYLDPAHVEPMFDRFGNIGPAIWADGRIVGGWVQRANASIVYELFTKLSSAHRRLLDEAIEQLESVLEDVVVRPRFPVRMQKGLLQ